MGRPGVSVRHRRRQLPRLRRRDDQRRARAEGRVPADQDDPGRLQRQLRIAGRGARSAQLGVPLSLHAGGSRRRDRQHRAPGALRRDSRRGAQARGDPDLSAGGRRGRRRHRGGRFHRVLPRPLARRYRGAARRAAAGGAAVARRGRGLEGGPHGRSPDRARRRALAAAARHHQRSADGRHARGRPPVQRQPVDRRRGAAERRGDEGRGRLPGAAHGEGGRLGPRQGAAGDGQGRRPRHRQEPGRHRADQQRLRGGEPRHQGAQRAPDPGGARARARCHRALGPAGQERAADGAHRWGPRRPSASLRRSWSAARR